MALGLGGGRSLAMMMLRSCTFRAKGKCDAHAIVSNGNNAILCCVVLGYVFLVVWCSVVCVYAVTSYNQTTWTLKNCPRCSTILLYDDFLRNS